MYERDVGDYEHVVTDHLCYMTRNTISVEPVLHYLPSFYWLPNSTKPLSKLLTACLSKIADYCDGIYSRTGVNSLYILEL